MFPFCFSLYVNGCFACTCVNRGQKKAIGSPRTGVAGTYEPSCGCWEWKLASLQKTAGVQATKTPLQPPLFLKLVFLLVCLCEYMLLLWTAPGGQDRVSAPLELELKVAVSTSAGNRTWVHWKASAQLVKQPQNTCFYHYTHIPLTLWEPRSWAILS